MKLINLKNYLIKNYILSIILLIIFFTSNTSNANNNFKKYLKKEIYSNKLSQLEIDNIGNFFKNIDENSDNKLTYDEINKFDFLYQIQLNKFEKFKNKKKFYPQSHVISFENKNFMNFFRKNKNFFKISDKDIDYNLNKSEFLEALITNYQLISFLNKFLFSLNDNFNYHQYDFYNAKINYFLLYEYLLLKNNLISDKNDFRQNNLEKDYLFYYTFLDLYEIAIQE